MKIYVVCSYCINLVIFWIKMKTIVVILLACLIANSVGIQQLLNTPTHECIKCLCHAVSGCYRRENCARYSISNNYWKEAGSPVVSRFDEPNEAAYKKCMQDENCILNTIFGYTSKNRKDTNCDGEFNCKDLLSIHLQQSSKTIVKTNSDRFNNCVRRLELNGLTIMRPEEFECQVLAN